MIGSVDPFAGSGKICLRSTVLLGNAALLLVHLDHDARHRFCVPTDVLNVLIGHRFRVVAEQFPTASDRNRFGSWIGLFDVLHGTPANSLQTFVLRWSALEARRHDVGAETMSVGCGVTPTPKRVT